jgi:polar amino acid transport system substrate-binding protein
MVKRGTAVLAFLVLALALVLSVSACGGGDESASDLLASIEEKGTITFSTDPAYPPQSELNKDTGEYEGFDIDVATEIAKRMDLEIAWETPAWDTLVAGNWNGRWDVSVGSMTITPERKEVLYFTPPYYYTPAGFAVNVDNTTITRAHDLDGKTIGVCSGCTYDTYLQGKLVFDEPIPSEITDPTIKGYDTDSTAIQDLALGDGTRLDAVISAVPTLEQAIKDGSKIKVVGFPLYFEPLAVAVDRGSELDPQSLVDELSEIIAEMHEDGTLSELSMKWYSRDLTKSESSS